jgi:hypothetical protein
MKIVYIPVISVHGSIVLMKMGIHSDAADAGHAKNASVTLTPPIFNALLSNVQRSRSMRSDFYKALFTIIRIWHKLLDINVFGDL